MTTRPYALSIAGFDPSAGAGILADIKTFESNGVYGFGSVSALTVQNDVDFETAQWLEADEIIRQIEVLLRRFDIRHIKIGLIKNMVVLQQLITFLKERIKEPVIIYDPVMKASAGFIFHDSIHEDLENILQHFYCITPNLPEANQLFGPGNLHDILLALSARSSIYLKGGHSEGSVSTDTLFTNNMTYTFSNTRLPKGQKHGSGCVLSSALTAQLALGNDLQSAAKQSNRYTHTFLASNETLLGDHQLQRL